MKAVPMFFVGVAVVAVAVVVVVLLLRVGGIRQIMRSIVVPSSISRTREHVKQCQG